MDIFVGDVSSYTLSNLQPGTTYDVKVLAQYPSGMSVPLIGQGTTRTYDTQTVRGDKHPSCLAASRSGRFWCLFLPVRGQLESVCVTSPSSYAEHFLPKLQEKYTKNSNFFVYFFIHCFFVN